MDSQSIWLWGTKRLVAPPPPPALLLGPTNLHVVHEIGGGSGGGRKWR